MPRPVNFQPKDKLLPHFLIGSRKGPATSWHSRWPRRRRRGRYAILASHSSHWPTGVAHPVSALSLVYHSPGGGASADEDNKGSRVASPAGGGVPVFLLPRRGEARGPPASPAPMKCEHCTRKVGAASGGTGEKARTANCAEGRARPCAPSFLPVSL